VGRGRPQYSHANQGSIRRRKTIFAPPTPEDHKTIADDRQLEPAGAACGGVDQPRTQTIRSPARSKGWMVAKKKRRIVAILPTTSTAAKTTDKTKGNRLSDPGRRRQHGCSCGPATRSKIQRSRRAPSTAGTPRLSAAGTTRTNSAVLEAPVPPRRDAEILERLQQAGRARTKINQRGAAAEGRDRDEKPKAKQPPNEKAEKKTG